MPCGDQRAATEGYLVTNYECRPGGVGKAYIRQADDRWEVLEAENINFDSVEGTWNTRFQPHAVEHGVEQRGA